MALMDLLGSPWEMPSGNSSAIAGPRGLPRGVSHTSSELCCQCTTHKAKHGGIVPGDTRIVALGIFYHNIWRY